ncbi:MAG: hypothetical protein ACRDRP_13735 [Pseudonocardiaceae bacterium]
MNPDNDRLNEIAARLDRLIDVPSDVLGEIVVRDGLCVWAFTHGEAPELTGVDTADRELAARLCEQCPAPAGLVAVFSDGRERPVLFYDVHGRAVLMDLDDVTCDLVLAEIVADTVRVEFRPARGEPAPD